VSRRSSVDYFCFQNSKAENLIEEGACVDVDSDFNSESMLRKLRLGKNSELALMATDIPLRVVAPPTPNLPHCSVALDEQCTSTITFCLFFSRLYGASTCIFTVVVGSLLLYHHLAFVSGIFS